MAQPQAESHHPDLTAMLDVVMQLLLYFIFTARLINEEVNAGDVHLPMSQAARPVTASDSDLLFVHVMADGKVYTAHDKPVVKNLDDTRYWLQKVANEEMSKKGKIDIAIVIRADRDASYESVYRVMGVCKEKKFTRFKLRAVMGGRVLMFGIHHKKHRGARNVGGVDIPITPMLDMTFQLLFFFIINYNPSPLEGQMDLTLPSDKDTIKKPDEIPKERNPDEQEDAPKDPPEVTVVVKTQHDGTNDGFVTSISLKTSAREVQVVGKDNKGLSPGLDELVDALKDLRENLTNKSEVKLQGDSRLKWKEIVRVRDACQRAGFTSAAFAPPPDLGVGGQ